MNKDETPYDTLTREEDVCHVVISVSFVELFILETLSCFCFRVFRRSEKVLLLFFCLHCSVHHLAVGHVSDGLEIDIII